MITLQIEVAGEVQIHRAISRFTEAVSDLRPIWPAVRDEFWKIEREQFGSQGAAGAHGAWQPLSPVYAAWKARNYPGQPTLVRTGHLMASLTGPGEGVDEEKPLSLAVGSSLDYGMFHQLGTSRMPARRPIDLGETQKQRLMKVIQRYLVQLERETSGPRGYRSTR